MLKQSLPSAATGPPLMQGQSQSPPQHIMDEIRPSPLTLENWVESTVSTSMPMREERHQSDSISSFMQDDGNVLRIEHMDDSEEDSIILLAANGAAMKEIHFEDEEQRLRLEYQDSASGPYGRSHSVSGLRDRKLSNVPIPARRGVPLNSFPDPIDLGLCTESEGRFYFDL